MHMKAVDTINNEQLISPRHFIYSRNTCGIFHLWLISATRNVATEHPHPMTAISTGSVCIPSKNSSRALT